jgi:hypothetical protein
LQNESFHETTELEEQHEEEENSCPDFNTTMTINSLGKLRTEKKKTFGQIKSRRSGLIWDPLLLLLMIDN